MDSNVTSARSSLATSIGSAANDLLLYNNRESVENEGLEKARWESAINLYKPSFIIKEQSEVDVQLIEDESKQRKDNNWGRVSAINYYSPSMVIRRSHGTASQSELYPTARNSSRIEIFVTKKSYSQDTLKEDKEEEAEVEFAEEEEEEESTPEEEESSTEECDSIFSYEFEEIPGSWGTHGLEPIPWDDDDRPIVKLTKMENFEFTPEELDGVLTDRIMAACSSYLDRSPETGEYVLCKANLSEKKLTDIDLIAYHHYIQYLDLSNNNLTNIEALGELPFLMYLDVSCNKLTAVLDFRAPFNLTYADCSNNTIAEIDDLTDFWSLVYLNLSQNLIRKIEGLDSLKYLKHLNLAGNEIERIENLNNMALETLNLENNSISRFEYGEHAGLHTLNHIISIKLGFNFLTTLKLFKGTSNVQSIEIQMNLISDLYELTHLRNLQYLTTLDLTDNIITTVENYWEVALSSLQNVMFLDGVYIDSVAKMLAFEKYRASMYMKAMQKQSLLFFNSQLNDPSITASVVPVDQPPPLIIVLVGPPGSKKRSLINQVHAEFPEIVRLGISHTNRARIEEEEEGLHYHFVSNEDFAKMVREGKFLTISEIIGNCYGFAQSELEKVTEEHLVLITHMDLGGALTLRAKGLRPYLILTLPSTDDIHRMFLREKYCYVENPYEMLYSPRIKNNPALARMFYGEGENRRSCSSVMSFVKDTLDTCIRNVVGDPEPEIGKVAMITPVSQTPKETPTSSHRTSLRSSLKNSLEPPLISQPVSDATSRNSQKEPTLLSTQDILQFAAQEMSRVSGKLDEVKPMQPGGGIFTDTDIAKKSVKELSNKSERNSTGKGDRRYTEQISRNTAGGDKVNSVKNSQQSSQRPSERTSADVKTKPSPRTSHRVSLLIDPDVVETGQPDGDDGNLVCLYASGQLKGREREDSELRQSGILKQRSSKLKRFSVRDSSASKSSTQSEVSEEMLKVAMARSRSVTFSEDPYSNLAEGATQGISTSVSIVSDDASCPILNILGKVERSTLDSLDSYITGKAAGSIQEFDGPMGVFFNEIMNIRKVYLEFHLSNPGVFSETIYSDETDTSLEKIRSVIQLAFSNFPASKHIYNYQNDPLYNNLVGDKVKSLIDELVRDYHNRGECSYKLTAKPEI